MWLFGNTTVRNPLRIREGLIALYQSPLNGNLNSREQESQFAEELNRHGIITLKRSKNYGDLGRKWRSCFSQLGFITHKLSRKQVDNRDPQIALIVKDNPLLSGRPYEITPNGLRMINADSIQEQQECMLRTLLSYEYPSIIEQKKDIQSFNPFFLMLSVLNELDEGISIIEMAILQTYTQNDYKNIVKEILLYRMERDKQSGTVAKRKFDFDLLNKLARGLNPNTLIDYADVNLRYSRFTGLFSLKGKCLTLNEKKRSIIDAILKKGPNLLGIDNKSEYLLRLWNGSVELPTDDIGGAVKEIERYLKLLVNIGLKKEDLPKINYDASVEELNKTRHQLESLYQNIQENKYAENQKNIGQIEETISYLKVLDRQERIENIVITDPPAYFEWAVWRAFLAINDLINQPYKSRQFRVDQDFLPIGYAPAGGPDMIFEFEDYILVVEVTLTSSSRQEASEGEPVRRHVALISKNSKKPVYGLFLARAIDNNTAETFRNGVWYNGDTPNFINIVPIALSQFISIMELFLVKRFNNRDIKDMLDHCLIHKNAHAPEWKREIHKVVNGFVSQKS